MDESFSVDVIGSSSISVLWHASQPACKARADFVFKI